MAFCDGVEAAAENSGRLLLCTTEKPSALGFQRRLVGVELVAVDVPWIEFGMCWTGGIRTGGRKIRKRGSNKKWKCGRTKNEKKIKKIYPAISGMTSVAMQSSSQSELLRRLRTSELLMLGSIRWMLVSMPAGAERI